MGACTNSRLVDLDIKSLVQAYVYEVCCPNAQLCVQVETGGGEALKHESRETHHCSVLPLRKGVMLRHDRGHSQRGERT